MLTRLCYRMCMCVLKHYSGYVTVEFWWDWGLHWKNEWMKLPTLVWGGDIATLGPQLSRRCGSVGLSLSPWLLQQRHLYSDFGLRCLHQHSKFLDLQTKGRKYTIGFLVFSFFLVWAFSVSIINVSQFFKSHYLSVHNIFVYGASVSVYVIHENLTPAQCIEHYLWSHSPACYSYI